ncbi:dol-P-Glc:Glc(2)Man(9)GlcNAc(2)-PP-Dol alpha-1,2-glucosyltransferase-like [Phragmites australis]|uniref:dol-P-Glc:Glc(2)Man(9)GlcNAc(2)-PP-Dol alpha-1,2-glucosyltransferase-like n=1 Tax=Phragmites australis TaxID=29695 RepID=UPI002D787D51|nr:dol-P-Glc:Glc(2)Man(9)GlcNAc(2)-PP-Dol alpha-1,2-glucosyltransferase-like [Phragmites australis]
MGRLAVAAAVAVWAIPIAALLDSVVPEPYMDEIFHVPQAHQYCHGDILTWDPMITTPPSPYYVSLIYVVSLFPVACMIRVTETFDALCCQWCRLIRTRSSPQGQCFSLALSDAGAKEAHVVSPHFAQFLYFGLVSAAALLPWHFTLSQVLDLFRWFRKKKTCSSLAVLMALGLSFIAVHFFSVTHLYLLADNRHYTFYIWRKFIQVNWMMKYILVPLYVFSWFSIINVIGKSQTRVWVLSFVLSVALVLVPAPLVEFRYYTIPFIILVLHSPVIGNSKLLALGSLYAAADLFTLAMFPFRPFHWEHEPGTQRFMW